jgi:DNA-directed RNA polymerase subunit omega
MDIISLPIEYDPAKIDSRHRIIAIASQRAKDISLGAKAKIKTKATKITSMAIEETIENAVDFLTGEEAKKAKELAGKFDYRKLLEERKREMAGEDLTELEKDLKVYLHEKGAQQDTQTAEELFAERQEEGAEE